MGSVKKAIKIYARLKPSETVLTNYEIEKHVSDDGTVDDILTLNTTNCESGDDLSANIPRPDFYKFRFSKVFDESSSQEMLFGEMCQPVLETALQGYNSTIFAYGQTGSGKTHTMTGSRHNWKQRGIIPRSISYIFDKFSTLSSQGFITAAFLSYLEIYNENGYDLLHSGLNSGRIEDLKKVQLLEDSQQQIHIKNLTVHPIKSEDEAMQLLYMGDHNRIIAETPMNEASTRSHCIFTIHLNIRESKSSTVRRSKVHLVDLAGSERLANSCSTGQLFHESRHINLALHYLEQVIVALGEANRSHIPYRNSMMTNILRDSLGGNCMTSMVATLSLDYKNLMETLSTCRFSQRVALVQNAAMMNEETDPMLLIAQLKSENKRLKEIIANSSVKGMEVNMEPLTQEEVSDCWKLVDKFISDQDDEAILPVIPDMRIVQTCFKCLKVAVNMSKEELTDAPKSEKCLNSKGNGDSSRKKVEDKVELDVRNKKFRRGTGSFRAKSITGGLTPHGLRSQPILNETGDGPRQYQSPPEPLPLVKQKVPQEHSPKHSGPGSSRNPSESLHPRTHAANLQNLAAPNNSVVDFNSDNLIIDGLPEEKKKALDTFLKSYHGTAKLARMQETFVAKRNDLSNIEVQLQRNQANLSNLKVVLMSCEGGPDDEDVFMREAVIAQGQSIKKQERQLELCKEDLRKTETTLKALYDQLLVEFERHLTGQQYPGVEKDQTRLQETIRLPVQPPPPSQYQIELNDTPSDNDLVLGASAASTCAVYKSPNNIKIKPVESHKQLPRQIVELPTGADAQQEKADPQKPITEMTKGIVKGVGGACSSPNFSLGKSQLIMSPKRIPSGEGNLYGTDAVSTGSPLSPRGKNAQGKSSRLTSGRDCPGKLQSPHSFLGDDDDDDLLKNLPMTGDETIDQEILSFFRTRQAVFRKINNDKNCRNTTGIVGEQVAN